MLVVRVNRNGYPVDVVDSLLPPPVENERVSFVVYKGRTVTTVTALAKEGERYTERVVALVSGKTVEVFGELPERLLERLGVRSPEVARRARELA